MLKVLNVQKYDKCTVTVIFEIKTNISNTKSVSSHKKQTCQLHLP